MKNRKGFTLIELLAVILILGIIMLIAIPTVTTIVNQAKKSAFKTSVQNIQTTVSRDCTINNFNDEEDINYYTFDNGIVDNTINVKGKLPTGGAIKVNKECKTSVAVHDNDYCVKKSYDDDMVMIDKYDPDTCILDSDIESTKMSCFEYILNSNDDAIITTWII